MIGIVVAAHGNLADALVQTAGEVVAGDHVVESVAIALQDDHSTFEERLRRAITVVDAGEGVLVLTDMFGGTPSNIAMMAHQPHRVEMLTGVNLPMVIKAFQATVAADEGRGPKDVTQIGAAIKETGLRSIALATEVLGEPVEVTAPNPRTEGGKE